MQNIFVRDIQTPGLTIAEKIGRCSTMILSPDNIKLPSKICTACLDDLDAAWRFQRKCESACEVFQSIIEDDSNSAYIELSKVKLPDNVALNKLESEPKTLTLPAQLRLSTEIEDLNTVNNEDTNKMDAEAEHLDDIIESEVEEESENIEIDLDYYEAEEIYSNDIIEVNREMEENSEITNKLTTKIKKEINEDARYTPSINTINIKKEKMDYDEESNATPEKIKRGRGRPKKTAENSLKTPIVLKSIKIESEIDADYYPTAARSNKHTLHDATDKLTMKPLKGNKTKHSPIARPLKICDICGNSYKYQHALIAHMRRHTNDRPFSCEFCSKAFVSAVELRRHMRVHTGHKPYACKFCDRRFSDYGSRIKHERTHTGERPYHCTSCKKSFAYAHVLSVHLRTHTGEKKFKCTICEKGFTKKTYLESHIQQHERNANIFKQDMQIIETLVVKDEDDYQDALYTITEYVEGREEESMENQIIVKLDDEEEEAALGEDHLEYLIENR
ncbi:zinc finger protein 184 [Teleopsis dalmanni]|uniref:zinc finger protein 184 n=1 Tax=Teleopsis dalmanni TaxID=139649 RepID=UPI0018CF369B|nr:zinc finger protein 184 [Teleopsis dalmanni]